MACILEELENTLKKQLKKQLSNIKNSKEFKDGAAKAKERVAELSTLLNEVGAMKKAMQGQVNTEINSPKLENSNVLVYNNSIVKSDKKENDKSIFKRSKDTYYTKNSIKYKSYRIPKPENKNLVSVRNIMQSMITALRSDLSFGNGVKDIEETYVKYSNIYTKEIKELSILLREHQLNLKRPHSLREWENIYKEDLKLNKKFDDTINALVRNLGLEPIIKSDQVDGYEFGFSAQFVTKEDNPKQEADIIVPTEVFTNNLNKIIDCKSKNIT